MKKLSTRRSPTPTMNQIAALIATSSFAAMMAAPAFAQTAAPAAPATPAAGEANDKTDLVNLNRIVVTGTAGTKSKMRSSVSVTDIDQEVIKDFGVRSEAEVLLLIPGIRTSPTAGPGGNSNISVRGLPITSGGSKYVQLQEDGLPTVQFGDMNFSNNDYWTRFDNNVDSIQTQRGGSSAVFGSHAPGALINYISKTGKVKGGSVGLTRGLNYNETRFDGDYGGRLAPDMYFHVGGYYREGEGARHTTSNSLLGFQLKGNLTKEFNGGKGYIRVNFKVLDEHAPTTPQTFLSASQTGNSIGGFDKVPGYDGTRDSQYSIYNSSMLSVNPATRVVSPSSLVDGITANSKSIGFEFHNELANGFSVDNKFRKSTNAGAFQAQFWDVQTLGNMLGSFKDPAGVALVGAYGKFANGPQAGTIVTAANLSTAGLVSKGAAINVQTPDMGNLVNDLSVAKQFKTDVGTLDVRGGYFHSRQNVVQTWAINERIVEVGKNGALIDVYDAANVALTSAGLTGYNNQWGTCCTRDINAQFTTDAPYLSLNLASGPIDVDAGIRHETFKANGRYSGSKLVGDTDGNGAINGTEVAGMDVNGDGAITGAEKNVYVANTANPGLVNYKVAYTNYSLGLNYRLNADMSAFVRHSKGHRAIADRLLYSANINSATGLLSGPDAVTAAVAPIKQSEIGAKFKGNTAWGTYGVAATLFHSTTLEYDYDQTRRPENGPKLNVVGTKADGIELDAGFGMGNFTLNVGATYSKEVITANLGAPGDVGKTFGGVPKWRYTIAPRYQLGDLTFGATVRGQSWVYADGSNTRTIDGHFVVNAFANYDFGNGFVGSLNVNNLMDKAYPAAGGGFVGGSTTVFGADTETGRTISASVRYNF